MTSYQRIFIASNYCSKPFLPQLFDPLHPIEHQYNQPFYFDSEDNKHVPTHPDTTKGFTHNHPNSSQGYTDS